RACWRAERVGGRLQDRDVRPRRLAGICRDGAAVDVAHHRRVWRQPWQRLVDMARVAQRQGVIKGILLHQGESNTNDAAWPDKVANIYRNLLAELGLDAARVPLLAGEVVNADQQGAAASVNEIIARL